jgi:ribose-phosphate pyrophosphokinase
MGAQLSLRKERHRSMKLKIFSGNSNRPLVEKICQYLSMPLGRATVGHFPNGETNVKIDEDVRGTDVYVVQSTCPPVNETLMELLVMIDCLKRASVARLTAVIPHYGYARQDRKHAGRVPITAKLVANLLVTAGAERVLTIDLHADQIQGFFDIPLDHLMGMPIFVDHYKRKGFDPSKLVICSPDPGSIKMAEYYARRLDCGIAAVDKIRTSAETVRSTNVIGNVRGKTVIMVDDIIATGSSIFAAAQVLKENGAGDIYVAATHPVFCGSFYENLAKAPLKEFAVTDTIPINDADKHGINVLSMSGLLGEAIKRIHCDESISSLFK